MLLRSLRLNDFRAHAETRLEFADKINLLHGPNGAGKTNILEAVHYLCLSKSFVASSDGHVVRRGAEFFQVDGRFEGHRRPELDVRLVYAPEGGKRMFVNGAPLDRLADIVGLLPVVVLAPEDYVLTAGGPEERRRFLDNTLSQARPAYLDDLLRYRRALKQRNALLASRRGRHADEAAIDAWSQELVQLGARIIWRRQRFVISFKAFLERAYQQIDAVAEEPSITYRTAVAIEDCEDGDQVVLAFGERLSSLARAERERGRTLAGPHRDELVFRIGGFEVRPYASQGQHRTFALAVRLATFFFLQDHLEEMPLLLLDDVFGTLDGDRARVLLDLLESDAVGQSLLTAARLDAFTDRILASPEHNAIPVVHGGVAASASR